MKTINRFFGSKSSKYPIKSTASPDGQYVLSGSEDGKPYLWDVITGELMDLKHLGVSFMGPVSDVAWNSEYHMIAFAGFGDQYPILVFASKAQDVGDMTRVFDKMRTLGDHTQKDEDLTDSPSAEIGFRVRRLAVRFVILFILFNRTPIILFTRLILKQMDLIKPMALIGENYSLI